MKLNQKKIRYLIRKKEQGLSSSKIAVHLKMSKRRVNQIWRGYNTAGILPINGQKVGRPKKALSSDEEAIVKEAYEKYRFGARMLESIIRKDNRKKHTSTHETITYQTTLTSENNTKNILLNH